MKKEYYICPACRHDLNPAHICPKCLRNFSEPINYNDARKKFTPEQELARELLRGRLTSIIKEYATASPVTNESVNDLIGNFTELMKKHYHVPAYDVYPWLLKPHKPNNSNNKSEVQKITAKYGQIIEIKVPLVDQVPKRGDMKDGDIEATVRVINNQIEIEVPDVETANDAPGSAIPILVEQTGGQLHLAAWDENKEDPFINAYWPKTLTSEEALAEARRQKDDEEDWAPF